MSQSRRHFLCTAAGATMAYLPLLGSSQGSKIPSWKYRAAIIGHTGRGDYGHNLDLIFAHRRDVDVVAVADPVAEGRAQAASRSGARRQYTDYQKMLETEKPDLVSVAPRWTDQHHLMALAALRAGAHVFMEKPITRTLAEADELLAVAAKSRLQIAVAHQMRLAPSILYLKQQIDAGLIGNLLEIRAHGKQDHRAGGEDLLVLGVHLFDLMRFFAGDAQWCAARVLEKGQVVTISRARAATEDIGQVVGDEVSAQFAFANGINATFTSRQANQQSAGPWGMELIGSKGAARILADICPRIFFRNNRDWRSFEWQPVEGDPTAGWSDAERSVPRANDRVMDDWLDAIKRNREPVCNGFAGMKALEMAHAVLAAGISAQRVELPLRNRHHPLSPG